MLAEELLVMCSASWRYVCTRRAGSGTDAGVASPAGVVGAFSLLRENRVAQQHGGLSQPSFLILSRKLVGGWFMCRLIPCVPGVSGIVCSAASMDCVSGVS